LTSNQIKTYWTYSHCTYSLPFYLAWQVELCQLLFNLILTDLRKSWKCFMKSVTKFSVLLFVFWYLSRCYKDFKMFDETNPKTSKFYCLFFGILPEVICRDFEIFLKWTKFFLKVNEMKPKVTLFHQPLCGIRLEVLKA